MTGRSARRHARRALAGAAAAAALLAIGGCWSDLGGASGSRIGQDEVPTEVQTGPNVRYVSPDGRDDAPGTRRKPWRTLGHALPALNAGQVLYVREGTYREDLRKMGLHQGLPDDGILVQAYPGERPVVRGLVWLRQPSYWTVDGLNVTWDDSIADPPSHLVKITGGVGWTWRNSEIWGGVAAANVLVAGYADDEPADWSFVGNCVHGLQVSKTINRGSNMTVGEMGDDAGPGTIERNLFFDNPTGRNLTLGYRRGGDYGGPTGVLVRFNTLYDSVTALTLAGDTADVDIERNILGDITSRTLVRARRLAGDGGVRVQQNLGIGAEQFFARRWRLTGNLSTHRAGNIQVTDVDFDDTSSCDGFNTTDSVVLPYGRDAIG